MPKNLTDVSQWNTVAVPVGTDAATAASVETPFQILTDRSKYLWDLFSEMRLANWFNDTDLTSVTSSDNALCFCYDAYAGIYTIGLANGYSIYSRPTGLDWDDEGGAVPTGPNPGAGNDVTSIDADLNGRRIACAGSSDDVYTSIALGTWSACTIQGSPALDFDVVGADKSGSNIWHIADSATPSAVYRSTSGTSFASVTVTGLTTTVRSIIHSGDSNNVWILMTDSQCCYSTNDGVSWTTVSHGLGGSNQRGSLAYDPVRERFVVLLDGGRDVGYSDDFGATWTKITNALPETITGSPRRLVANSWGELLAWCGTLNQLFSSHDGGATWTRRYTPADTAMAGSYCVVGCSETMFLWATISDIQRSLR